jgi:UDP-N-acetylmuramate-alanine ligase
MSIMVDIAFFLLSVGWNMGYAGPPISTI